MNEVFGLDLKAWEMWLQYRKEIRKPLKAKASFELAQKKLASFGDQQMAVVENSITNGWTGLFPPPKEKAAFKAKLASDRESRDFEELKSRAARVGFRQPTPQDDLIGYKTLVQRAEHSHAMSRPVTRGPQPINKLLSELS
jgi:hypothetical protein